MLRVCFLDFRYVVVCGNIYTYGGNGEGQLGVPDLTRTHIPQHVSTLPPATYKMLSAGCDHSMALTGGAESSNPL